MQNFRNFRNVEDPAYFHYWALSSFALRNEDERYIYFQQDGARAHMSEQTMEFFREFFNERLVSVGLWDSKKPRPNLTGFFSVGKGI